MSVKTPILPTRSPNTPQSKQNSDLTAWPQWMREALSHVPDAAPREKAVKVDEPVHSDRANVRILSRVPTPQRLTRTRS